MANIFDAIIIALDTTEITSESEKRCFIHLHLANNNEASEIEISHDEHNFNRIKSFFT